MRGKQKTGLSIFSSLLKFIKTCPQTSHICGSGSWDPALLFYRSNLVNLQQISVLFRQVNLRQISAIFRRVNLQQISTFFRQVNLEKISALFRQVNLQQVNIMLIFTLYLMLILCILFFTF